MHGQVPLYLLFSTIKHCYIPFSLLSVGVEGNRRTADVRVKGFTNLFILSKADFESAMSEFPAAHKMLKKRARYIILYISFLRWKINLHRYICYFTASNKFVTWCQNYKWNLDNFTFEVVNMINKKKIIYGFTISISPADRFFFLHFMI